MCINIIRKRLDELFVFSDITSGLIIVTLVTTASFEISVQRILLVAEM